MMEQRFIADNISCGREDDDRIAHPNIGRSVETVRAGIARLYLCRIHVRTAPERACLAYPLNYSHKTFSL